MHEILILLILLKWNVKIVNIMDLHELKKIISVGKDVFVYF